MSSYGLIVNPEPDQANGIAKAFANQFPKVKVNFTTDLSKYVEGRINKAIANDELYADATILQTLHNFDAWANRGLLLPYKPPHFDKIWLSLTRADGSYIPVFGCKYLLNKLTKVLSDSMLTHSSLTIAHFGPFVYNPSVIPAADVPKSYADILDPKWKGKIVLTYPNDDDAVLYLFKVIIEQYGWIWLDRLLQQDVQWVRGTATPGEILVLDPSKKISFTSFPAANGWTFTPPVSDVYTSWAQSSAIFKHTRLPETAKLLQAFLISEAGQNVYIQQGLPTVRRDIPGSKVTMADDTNTEYVTFHQFMRDRATVEAFRLQIEDKVGTAQGISPLIDGVYIPRY